MKTFMLLTLLGAARGTCPAFDAKGATPEPTPEQLKVIVGGYSEWAVADDWLEKELGSAVKQIRVKVWMEFSRMQAEGANVASRVSTHG